VPARYLGTLWTADYWCVPIMVQPSASGCSYSLQTAEIRQTIYGHLALQALSCGTVYTPGDCISDWRHSFKHLWCPQNYPAVGTVWFLVRSFL